MITMKDELVRMLEQMDAKDVEDITLPAKRLGRKPSHKEKYKNIGISIPPELEHVLLMLVEQRGTSMSALVRELIKLGLPVLTGQHIHELLEVSNEQCTRTT